jgi:hypothetical protein
VSFGGGKYWQLLPGGQGSASGSPSQTCVHIPSSKFQANSPKQTFPTAHWVLLMQASPISAVLSCVGVNSHIGMKMPVDGLQYVLPSRGEQS